MTDCDVVIAGAGITGAILANKLGQAGLRVIVLDAGDTSYFTLDPHGLGTDRRQPLLDRFFAALAQTTNAPYPDLPYAPSPQDLDLGAYYTGPAYTGGTGPKFQSTYTRMVGGTSMHWLGTCLRYVPSTFREQTLYERGADWPITYRELADWYWQAEQELGVSGDSARDLGAPRFGKPLPMPRILPSYSDRRIAERLRGMTFDDLPVLVEPTPQARNSIPFGDRPPCAGSANCIPICPIQAKYDATVHLKRALDPALDPHDLAGSVPVELRHGAVVTRVVVDASGDRRVRAIAYKQAPGGGEHTVTARHYVLACHAIEIPKILLLSPWGERHTVANSSDAVGRYLMDHNIKMAIGKIDEPLYPFRGPGSTSGVESLRDGPFRKHRAAFRVELQNTSASWALNTPYSALQDLLNANVIGRALYDRLGWEVSRTVQINALLEPEPQRDSTIRPSTTLRDKFGIPRPEIRFVIDDYTQRGADAFARLAARIFEALGARPGEFAMVDGYGGAGHVMGTHRMGDDPKTSVTDSYGRTHDHPNLWLTGSGLFPTVDAANPTLTIAAVTLRTAARMIDELAR